MARASSLAAIAAACAIAASTTTVSAAKQPNIIFILTDDQDVEMGSLDFMPKLKTYLSSQGATFTRMYASVPVCCPSRSSLYSGQYQHNNGVLGNAIATNCSSREWQAGPETRTFATYLQAAGMQTSFAGKYLNDYGSPSVGGVAHIPPGWTNWQGLVGNSIYYSYTLSNNGKAEQHGNDYAADYLPDLVLNKTLDFIDSVLAQGANAPPFLAYLSPPSCHGPQDAAPQYQDLYPGQGAPRTPAFGAKVADTHWIQDVQAVYGLDANSAAFADLVFRRRVQTLASVDDMIEAVVQKLSSAGVLDNTYIMYSTDNGYHTGQYGFIYDKRQPWETDVHLPFFIRGPGIAPNITVDALVSMPDLAATVLDIAGLPIPPQFDGISVLPYVISGRAGAADADGDSSAPPARRQMTLVEYHGETADGGGAAPACAETKGTNLFCNPDGNYSLPPFFYGKPLCVCQDAANNTYACLRVHNETVDFRYCEFQDSAGTVEYFDYVSDPYELTNLAPSMDGALKAALSAKLAAATSCGGSSSCEAVLTSFIEPAAAAAAAAGSAAA